ncbi:hypothetical protein JRO89_XSUnG0068100 [Xanthoceras sorbifolium]|uniref:Uncharacterized protein n=1 Tax=Xanthoceras sorbifolium TaxID=99658 RepID=A0ABQ8GZP1_9ROSI|nr:hypothetical protein JRO89_XSUnG0068100 [Xanthoceras sorbifolium]
MLMEYFLRSKEYWHVVSDGIAEPSVDMAMTNAQRTELEGQRLKDLKDTSKHIWDSMKKKYQGFTRVKRQQLQTLRSEFETLRIKSGESVTYYFSWMMEIVTKIRIHGDKLEDVTIVKQILQFITPKFNFVVRSIEEANDIEELSIGKLQSSLLHQKGIEDEAEAEVRAEETMIVATTSTISIMKINFKEEEEDEEATTQQLIDQSQQTSPILNVTDVIAQQQIPVDLDGEKERESQQHIRNQQQAIQITENTPANSQSSLVAIADEEGE